MHHSALLIPSLSCVPCRMSLDPDPIDAFSLTLSCTQPQVASFFAAIQLVLYDVPTPA